MKSLEELDLKSKKIIIFDMDGTLIDSIGIWNLLDHNTILKFANKDIDLEVIQKDRNDYFINNKSGEVYLNYCEFIAKKYNINMSKEELHKKRKDLAFELLVNTMDYKDNAPEVVKKLYDLGYTLVLATTTTRFDLDIYANKNKTMMEKLALNNYFDYILSKEDVKNKKPDPEIYLKVLEHYNVNASDCIVIEDSIQGITSAKNAGLETINIYDKYSDCDRANIDFLTDYKINNFIEFNDYINKIHDIKILKKDY